MTPILHPHDAYLERLHAGQRVGRLWRVSPESDWRKAADRPPAARWHTRGADVLYTSCCETLAVIEALAHLAHDPTPHHLLSFEFPEGSTLRIVDPASLPRDWKRRHAVTRAIGDAWLRAADSDLLWVPSVHAMYTGNVLFNPVCGMRPTMIDHGLYRFNVRLRKPKSGA